MTSVSKFVEPVVSDNVTDCSSSCTSAASDIVAVDLTRRDTRAVDDVSFRVGSKRHNISVGHGAAIRLPGA